jgi:hypothetical protein
MPVRRLCGYLSGSYLGGLTITDAVLPWAKDECGVLALRSVTMTGCRAFVSCVFTRLYLGAAESITASTQSVAASRERNFSRWVSPVGVRRLSCRSPGWCSGLVG